MRHLAAFPILFALVACDDKGDDGDGDGDGNTTETDFDGDGSPAGEDCNDQDASIHPGAEEICDNVDNNCDDNIDEGVTTPYFADVDGDGYGAGDSEEACEAPTDYVEDDSDCDDGDADINPAATEECDGVDNDCDGEVDEGVTGTYYPDADGDGFGVDTGSVEACEAATGMVPVSGDCDDDEPTTYPGAEELCDHKDQDCDEVVDNGVEVSLYTDGDNDGYGDSDTETLGCLEGSGMVTTGGDCDDGDDTINPGASETCNGVDDDCDASTSEDGTVSFASWCQELRVAPFGMAALRWRKKAQSAIPDTISISISMSRSTRKGASNSPKRAADLHRSRATSWLTPTGRPAAWGTSARTWASKSKHSLSNSPKRAPISAMSSGSYQVRGISRTARNSWFKVEGARRTIPGRMKLRITDLGPPGHSSASRSWSPSRGR